MARREGPATKNTVPPQAETLTVRPVFEIGDSTAVFYINHAEVRSSFHEFSVVAGRAPASLTTGQIERARSEGTLSIAAEVELIVPITLITGLITALTLEKERYEAQYDTQLRGLPQP
jgi:hypothetical protein